MTTVQFAGVHVRLGEIEVLRGIDLTLTERRVGIIGPNGSGKSTLVRLINGLVAPSIGQVSLDGLDVARQGAAVRQRVGFVFSNPDAQIVMPTVREDVEFSLRRIEPRAEARRTRAAQALAAFDLEHLADRPAHTLSSGQKQLLALAAILVREPSLVIADEPATLLDARHSAALADRFASLDCALYMVTHDLEAVRACERVLVIDDGRVVADDDAKAAIAAYRRLLARRP